MDAALVQEVTDALNRADAEGYARGYATAKSELRGMDATALVAYTFADALASLASRIRAQDPRFSAHLDQFAKLMLSAAEPPQATVEPADGAVGVAARQAVTAFFDRDVDPPTVTLTVAPATGGVDLAGRMVYDPRGRLASFVPDNGWSSGVTYRATVDAATPGGRAMEPLEWTFTAA